ncbi:MAG: phage holin family protein [Pseudomonadota bacterium]|nr:phage holin family protein [Pseudomonadota bacterium]
MALDTHDPHVPRPVAGLFQSLNHFLATFVAIVHTRLELLTTELQEEVRQVGGILLWAFVAAFAVMMSLFLGALGVIFVFWDTHRLAAALAMVGLFVAVAVVAGLILRHKLSSKPPLLDDTLAELAKDRDQLKARL